MFPPVPNNLRNQRIKWIKEGDSNFSRSCLNTSSLVSENIDIRYFIKLNGHFYPDTFHFSVGYSYYTDPLISISTVDTLILESIKIYFYMFSFEFFL